MDPSPGAADLLGADVDAFAAAFQADLAAAREAVAALKALPDDASFADVVAAYDAIGHPLNRSASLGHLFFQAHPDAAMRDRAAVLEQEVSRFGTELSLDRDVYDRLVRLDLDTAPDATSRRIVEHALRDFRRAGVDRDEATRDRVRELREEIVELGQTFSRNIATDVREIRLDSVDDLEGLPDDYVASHPPEADGSVRITTNPPDVMPFMKFARRREHRRALHRAYTSRGTPDNLAVLDRLLAARHELAVLLGYENWAAYATEDKMIRTPQRASEFIDRVTELTGRRMEEEAAQLLEALRAEHPEAAEVRDYDRSYLVETVRRRDLDFDVREARPYLAYDAVRNGVLDVISRLYGVAIERRRDVDAWHEDVEVYDVSEGGERLARFFLDMHPRDDKYKHACMIDIETGLTGRVLPSACLLCNLPKPGGNDPALLDPSEVTTLFHEFGHLMHHLLAGRHQWLEVSGIRTEWDFVEVPSQLFEEWPRDPEVLASFARHHETGEPIDAALVERLNRAQDYGKGLSTRVQMLYASLSLQYYSRDPSELDTTELLRELKSRYVPFPHEEGTAFQASFGHLNGYSALYYTYMWSLVLAKDCLSAFDGDLMNAETAERYRRCVLEPGGTKDAEDLLTDFLGRPFSFDAFEAWLAV